MIVMETTSILILNKKLRTCSAT